MTEPSTSLAPAERLDLGAHGRELILDARNIAVDFKVEGGVVNAVRDVSFQLHKGETIALVGESGSGKSVTARTIMRLLTKRATIKAGARVMLRDRDIVTLSEAEMRKLRGNDLTMIFQEPMSSLNPVYTIGQQLCEVLHLHNRISRAEAMQRAEKLLEEVQIPEPGARLRQYPHQLSGGQRQRVMIAMALANRPDVLIADEPTTALDVTVQAQILDMLTRLREDLGIGLVLITHDLGVVAGCADAVAVMYAGRVVETAGTDDLFYRTRHPYTIGLLGAVPRVEGEFRPLVPVEGAPPTLSRLPAGCAFHPRCGWAVERCRSELPELRAVGAVYSACHRAEDLGAGDLAPEAVP